MQRALLGLLITTSALAQTEVIVVGAGIAGLSAALEAARGGATVTVIDRSSVFGGHAVVSGGNVCIVATPLQESQKIRDSAEIAFQDFLRWGEDADPQWARYYAENSRQEIYDWLTEMGVGFQPVSWMEGNSVPRYHWTKGKGVGLVSPIYRECLRLPTVTFVWNTRVTELLVERGRVTGVRAESLRSGSKRNFRAPAVILATGGFGSNLAMVRQFWPKDSPVPPRLLAGAGRYADGSGHAMAQKAGGVWHNMDHQWNYAHGLPDPRDPSGERGTPSFPPFAIWVNAEGKRFANEYVGARGTVGPLLAQKGASFWAVFDEAGARGLTFARWSFDKLQKESTLVRSAPTLEALAAQITVPAPALAATVAHYNRMVDQGRDTDFGRFPYRAAPPPKKIEKPPFHAMQYFPITRKTMGGVKVDLSCRVLDGQGRPIPGLYAAGEVTGFGGINGKAALEGTFLGPSIVMGRVAARHAVGRRRKAVSTRPLAVDAPRSTISDGSCAQCHDLKKDLAKARSSYWHYEKSHQVVLERNLQCGACHAEFAPYRRGAHRIDRMAQIANCATCHGG